MADYYLNIKRKISGFIPDGNYHLAAPVQLADVQTGNTVRWQGISQLETGEINGPQLKRVEQLLAEAEEQAYRRGLADGHARGREESDHQFAELQQLAGRLEKQWLDALKQLEEPLLEIARQLAEIILGVSAFNQEGFREAMEQKLRQFLDALAGQKRVVVELHPQTLQLLEGVQLFTEPEQPGKMPVHLQENKSLRIGECLVHSEDLFIDGTFATQLQQVSRQIAVEA